MIYQTNNMSRFGWTPFSDSTSSHRNWHLLAVVSPWPVAVACSLPYAEEFPQHSLADEHIHPWIAAAISIDSSCWMTGWCGRSHSFAKKVGSAVATDLVATIT